MQASSRHAKHVVSDRLCYFKPKTEHREKSFAEELSRSLRQNPKSISPKFLYDKKGSRLFEEICGLPEYYLTRTEIRILSRVKRELRVFLNGRFRLVELGSGASIKTRHVLDVLQKSQSSVEYVPIDISDSMAEGAADLIGRYPDLNVVGIVDTYERGLEFVKNHGDSNNNNLIAFFGSSFGNFPFKEGELFLRTVRDCMGDDDLFLVGLDLVKEKSVLEDAYDDARGVTAQFNLNVLDRINCELGANFDPGSFSHHCVYNEGEQRVEMYLRSLKNQSVAIPKANLSLSFGKGELVHTESSHKYTVPKIGSLMGKTGLRILRLWQDPGKKFAVVLASKNQASSAHLNPENSHLSSSLKKFL